MIRRTLPLLGLAIVFSGCSSATKIQVLPKEPLNGGSTVHIRVFQLKDMNAFTRADFEELWNDAKKALGDQMIGGGPLWEDDILPPKPNQKPVKIVKEYKEEQISPETVYFGMAALFTPEKPAPKDEQMQWKKVVLRKESNDFVFILHEYKLEVKED